MSTTLLSMHDLLRITYTYEARALEEQAKSRKRSDSACAMPEQCSNLPSSRSLSTSSTHDFASLETDFTFRYSRSSSLGNP
ncbi:hypothetical protein CC86DRAFT_464194 [Ophiobolus disseminans]|uniref:Uncharacterized protein n=1 Tax=Ophiobolus disseminans TaxID=1469910 RepID=A0A6A7A932_9PLEO|nr:hypothetical protein CC86DRAFT_464194 [Ophiobolus disseminans]